MRIDHPVEISNEMEKDSVQYGLLTEYSKTYYHIDAPQAWIVLEEKNEWKCTHALTYLLKRKSDGMVLMGVSRIERFYIYSSPLEDSVVVGNFTNPVLICDTLLNIGGVQWAVLHHSMYNSLKLNGIPQAWVMLESQEQVHFEKVKESEAFVERLRLFREELTKSSVFNKHSN